MTKLFRFIFVKYNENPAANYKHSGVGYTGYTGLDNELCFPKAARIYHSGVGYTGIE